MRRVWAGLLLMAVLAGCGPTPAEVDQHIDALRQAIGNNPLSTAAATTLAVQKKELDALTRDLENRRAGRDRARRDWQVGECQRLRHLFDEPDAWEKAERSLNLALARNPKYSPAHLSLGQLYLAGGLEMAPHAEHDFVRSLEESSGSTSLPAHKGLFLACYYQGRWADAVKEADKYLAAVGTDTDVKKMRDMAETNLNRENKTK